MFLLHFAGDRAETEKTPGGTPQQPRNGWKPKKQKQFLWHHRLRTIGNGSVNAGYVPKWWQHSCHIMKVLYIHNVHVKKCLPSLILIRVNGFAVQSFPLLNNLLNYFFSFKMLLFWIQTISSLITVYTMHNKEKNPKKCSSLNFFLSLTLPSIWHFAIRYGLWLLP